MPRTPRKKSITGIYHVMLRGVNRQQIFYDEEDCRCFVRILQHYKPICGYQLLSYCIMGNHIHILLRIGGDPLEIIFKRVGTAFVYWYNQKYERTGHLFQDRYKSEAVNSERYFLTVLRYILQNPVKAGICSRPENYLYSSAREYLLAKQGITDTEFALKLLGRTEISEYINAQNSDQCLELEDPPRRRLTDTAARKRIFAEFGTITPPAGGPSDRQALNASIRKLLSDGISIRQLSRLTGISKKVIENSRKNRE